MNVSPSKKLIGALLVCALLSPGLTAQATVSDDPTTVTLEKSIHFLAPDGSDVLVEPGVYAVETAEEWISLIPGNQRKNALLVESSKGTHEEEVLEPVALSLPGDEETPDSHVISLLLPSGQTLEATGTYSGIRDRGWNPIKKYKKKYRKKMTRKYKKKYRTKLKKNPRLAKRLKQNPKLRKGFIQHETKKNVRKEVREIPKHIGNETKELWNQKDVLACKAFFKAQEEAAKLQEGLFREVQKGVNALRKNSKMVNDVIAEAEKFQRLQKRLIDQAIQSALQFNKPTLLKKVSDTVEFDKICETGIVGTQKKIQGLLRSRKQIRSRGIPPVFNIGIQGAGTYSIGGMEGGAGVATNFQKAKGGLKGYGFIGGTLQIPSAGASVVAQVGSWNPMVVKSPADLAGGYLAVGYTIPVKELAEHIEGYGNSYWANAEGSHANFVVIIDILFSWPDGQSHPNPIPAGIVVSPGWSGGISKAGNAFFSKHLGRITIQGGYTWMFGV